MWNIGAAEMITDFAGGVGIGMPCSASVIAAAAPLSIEASRKWMLLRCDSITPLGRPVVPLVKRMTNGSSSSSVDVGERRVGRVRLRARRSRPRTTSTGRSSGELDAFEALEPAPVAEQDLRFGELDRVRDLLARPPAVEPDGHARRARRSPRTRARTRPCSARTIATRSPGPTPYLSRSAAATAAIGWRIDANVYSRSGKIT